MTHAPRADKKAHRHARNGDVREDPWYWLRERDNPEVISYLEAENAYTDRATSHTKTLQKELYDDMLSRIQETDLSVPARRGRYYYFSRTEKGSNYPIYCRSKHSDGADEEIILDVNLLAKDHEYFSLGVFSVSPKDRYLAYSIDTEGNEDFQIAFKDLATGETTPQTIPNTYYDLAWANDESTVFYTTLDSAHRPWRVYRNTRGAKEEQATLVYQEDDERFYVELSRSLSGEFIFLHTGSNTTDEYRVIKADEPTADFKVIRTREQGVEYSASHHGDYFYLTNNHNAPQFKLDRVSVRAETDAPLDRVIEEQTDTTFEGVSVFAEYFVLYERHAGLPQISIYRPANDNRYTMKFDEAVYEVSADANLEFDTNRWRLSYSSPTTPRSIIEFNFETKERILLKQQPVLGGFDSKDYVTERLWASAVDGARIPISLVRKRIDDCTQSLEEPGPLLLTAYGSYGAGYPASFSTTRLALLDRGVTVAIAHIRGGDEMGRDWYDSGKLLNKKNSFSDFICAAEYLIDTKRTTSSQLSILGGSAGGLLMGAVLNLRPELFKAVVAQVPFVDTLTTILDESLPLSVYEWEEWGNPNEPRYYEYIKGYSPYDNVKAGPYPATLATAGLNDPRVAYWEPAKWVAKLRDVKTDNNPLLLKTNMGAGHGGASGRYGQLEEIAFEYAFVLDQILAD